MASLNNNSINIDEAPYLQEQEVSKLISEEFAETAAAFDRIETERSNT